MKTQKDLENLVSNTKVIQDFISAFAKSKIPLEKTDSLIDRIDEYVNLSGRI